MISPISLKMLAEACGGQLLGTDVAIESAVIDSRSVEPGDLFVALKGQRSDGHDFVSAANDAGCTAVVVEHDTGVSCPQLVVPDSERALAVLAGMNRSNFSGKVIALTGSSGKTTTKNMLASILAERGETLATKGNFNNEIGVPLTLLDIGKEHEYAVIEMGARHIGDIRYLCEFVRPDVAMLLNVGVAHIDVFGSYENIVSAKSEIFASLNEGGVAIINVDDRAAPGWLDQTSATERLTYSASDALADVWASNAKCSETGVSYRLHHKAGSIDISLGFPGMHNLENSLSAATAAIALGLDLETIARGLAKARNDAGRTEVSVLSKGVKLIDDSYNANPVSVKAALDVLALFDSPLRIAILGEMAELGAYSEAMHMEVAEYAVDKPIQAFYLIGEHARGMASVIGDRARVFDNKKDLAEDVVSRLTGKECILVKGSRSSAMDEVAAMITEGCA